MPDHPVALELLERTGPLAVSSANLTGQPAATDADEAEEMLGDDVAVLLDAGPSPGGAASTIVDVHRHAGPGAAARAPSACERAQRRCSSRSARRSSRRPPRQPADGRGRR